MGLFCEMYLSKQDFSIIMEGRFAYDQIMDSLLVFAKTAKDKVKGSVIVGNLVLDMTDDGRIVGIEIKKATEFFKEMDITKAPEEVESAHIDVNYKKDGVVLFLLLKYKNEKEQKVPIFVSSETPIVASANA